MSHEMTFCMIKPDSVKNRKLGAILSHLENEEFEIVRIKKIKLNQIFCETFYSEHKDREFFSSLIKFITSGPVIALALRRENGVLHLRKVMGATDPKKAEASTIRALYGSHVEQNAIHGSDSLSSAHRELALFFPEEDF